MLPLFAFLSGYVLGRPGGFRPKDYFRKRTLGLLVPYVVWETLYGPTQAPRDARERRRRSSAYYVHIFVEPALRGAHVVPVRPVARAHGPRSGAAAGGPHVGASSRASPVVFVARLVRAVQLVAVDLRLRVRRVCCSAGSSRRSCPRLRVLGVAGGDRVRAVVAAVAEPETVAAARLAQARCDAAAVLAALGHAARWCCRSCVGACAVVAILAASYRIPGWLEAPLAYLGTLSLGIYVTHFPFVEMWKGMPWWFLPVNVALATLIAVGWTLVLGNFRVTATLLLGEPWVKRPRVLGDVKTETL